MNFQIKFFLLIFFSFKIKDVIYFEFGVGKELLKFMIFLFELKLLFFFIVI